MILPNKITAATNPSRIAAEGHMALGEGDTDRARACYLEAGKLIERDVAKKRKQSEKHLFRFLAASQYYHGGHYEKALALGRKIEAQLLFGNASDLFPQFMKDATARAKPDYALKNQQAIARLWKRREHQAIIELFQKHPYVLPAPEMAAIRALCCEQIKEFRAAALFFQDAMRLSSQRPDIAFLSVSYAYSVLLKENKPAEVKEYLEHLVQLVPHALTFAGVSLLRYFEAASPTAPFDWKKLSAEQIHFFERAFALYNALPASHRKDQNFRNSLAEAAGAAASGFTALEQRDRALEVCAWSARLSPASPGQQAWITKAREAAVGKLLFPAG